MRSCSVSRAKQLVLRAARTKPLEDASRDRGIEQVLSRGHSPHRVDEVVRADLLQEVARRPGEDRLEERLVVGERGEDETRRARMKRADVATRFDAVSVLEPDIEHGDVGVERMDPSDCLLGRRRLADDDDVPLGLEQVADAAPHDLVVVEQEHCDALGLRHLSILA